MSKQQGPTGRKPLKDRTKEPTEAAPYAVNHWARIEILAVLHQAKFSAGEVAEILGEDVRYITGHMRELYAAGCIEIVEYRRTAGRRRPIYHAIILPEIDDEVWRTMSDDERHDASGAIVQGLSAEALSSHRQRKMATDDDLALIWDAHTVDAQGRAEIRDLIGAAQQEILAIESRAFERLAASEDSGTTVVVGLQHFLRGRSGKPRSGYFRASKK